MGVVSSRRSACLVSTFSHAEAYVACEWGPAAAVERVSAVVSGIVSTRGNFVIT